MKKKTKGRREAILWFSIGSSLTLFFLISFAYILFEKYHKERIYPGVRIAGYNFSGATKRDVVDFFNRKNDAFEKVRFSFTYEELTATTSAKSLGFGFNSELLADQALNLGRSNDFSSNLSLKLQALLREVALSPSYTFSDEAFLQTLKPISEKVTIEPVDALFSFQPASLASRSGPAGRNGRVVAFRPSSDGQEVAMEKLKEEVREKLLEAASAAKSRDTTNIIPIPVVVKKAKVQTSDANNLGIRELVGQGQSRFAGSIPNRIHNIQLSASGINGVLVPPGETFSFNQALGDVSKFTGYKEAFIIQGGRTILGDGGGVCQVSTTLFRAILNSGLPTVERHAHSYRVGYYEQDMGPGFDATVYAPNVDLKFKNDTENHILIQAYTNLAGSTLTFSLYGTGDNRRVTMSGPTITNQRPPPPPQYNDDPTLPKGVKKQIDFQAFGANVSFTRTVERNGETIIKDKFTSNFQPWQAVYLRGTRE